MNVNVSPDELRERYGEGAYQKLIAALPRFRTGVVVVPIKVPNPLHTRDYLLATDPVTLDESGNVVMSDAVRPMDVAHVTVPEHWKPL